VSSLRKVLGDANRTLQYIETVSGSGYRFIASVSTPLGADDGAAMPSSLAVLPARPLAHEASEQEWSMGLTIADTLIDRLGRVKQIVMRPTRSVHAYLRAPHDPAEAGRRLQVDAVVDSDFVRVADRLKTSAHLVRSRDGVTLWTGEFDEAATDLVAMAAAVAESVAKHLGFSSRDGSPAAGGLDRKRRTASQPRPPEVYELFGRGRSHLLSGSFFELPQAVTAFRAAIDLDPMYTTNRPTQDWGIFLGDVPAATAILDRFLAHAAIVQDDLTDVAQLRVSRACS
jgi:TolB-like protein